MLRAIASRATEKIRHFLEKRRFNALGRDFLAKHGKLGENPETSRYSFEQRECKTGYWHGTIYHDTRNSVVLWYRFKFGRREIAVIGFTLHNNCIVISQIQGIARGDDAKQCLKQVKWERMLLALVVELARSEKHRAVLVLKGGRNRWNRELGLERKERLHLHYDVTARRSGFRELDANYYALQLCGQPVAPGEIPHPLPEN